MAVPPFTEGADTYGGAGNGEFLDALGGNDTVDGGGGDDTIMGGAGSDILHGGAGDDSIDAGSGLSLVYEYLYGDDGNDTMLSSAGVYVNFYGGAGDDMITGVSFSSVEGGAGRDTLIGNGSFFGPVLSYLGSGAAVTIDLGTNFASGGDAAGDIISKFANVEGSAHNDRLTGTDQTNTLEGLGGKDSLYGLGGNDNMQGGDGDDSLVGGDGDDALDGGMGADVLDGGDGIDEVIYRDTSVGVVIDLAAGTATGGAAEGDTLSSIENATGSEGDDSITGSSAANEIYGEGGADIIRGGGGADSLNGGDGSFETVGSDDEIYGEGGNDIIRSDAGADTISGGSGTDTLLFNYSAVTVNLFTGKGSGADAEGDVYSSIENVTGSNQGDSITGSDARNVLRGGNGNDTIDGGAGNDFLEGGSGADSLKGGGGTDTATYENSYLALAVNLATHVASGDATGDTFSSIENLIGGNGDDSLVGNDADNVLAGNYGKDTLDGGAGNDTADFSDEFFSFSVTLKGSSLADVIMYGEVEDRIRNFENVTGGSGYDTITGDGKDNLLNGGGSSDVLRGGGGDDTLDGGAGIDTADYSNETKKVQVALAKSDLVTVKVNGHAEDHIRNIENVFGGSAGDKLIGDKLGNRFVGGRGADTIDGAGGIDTADYSDKTKAVVLSLGGSSSITVKVDGKGEDHIENIENVIGGSAADKLTGDGGANMLTGGDGKDTLAGGKGEDTLTGGAGKDKLSGGDGKDHFIFGSMPDPTSVDTIAGFVSGKDTIEIENYYFTGLATPGRLGSDAFHASGSGKAADEEDRILYETDTGKLFYDADGTGVIKAIQFAVLKGHPALDHTDFLVV